MSEMTEAAAKDLREPFDPAAVGKLPRTTCRDCSQSQNKVCNKHSKSKCQVCDNYMTTAHIHLDYVGHAAVTARLLAVDPEWTWEPVGFDPTGAPLIQRGDRQSRMWIRLTVCGVTRLGVGIAQSGKEEVEKELISDALRNAAMRFGVALDLWSKQDLHDTATDDDAPPAGVDSTTGEVAPTGPPPALGDIETMKSRELLAACKTAGVTVGGTVEEMRARLREIAGTGGVVAGTSTPSVPDDPEGSE